MRTAVILHSVSDARHCVENKFFEGNVLFSTHSSVDVYLKEKHGLDCKCLSGFLPTEELISMREKCAKTVGGLLKNLDSGLSPSLNKKFNLKLDYFTPLYFFYCGLQLLGYATFVDCVKRAADVHKPEKILFYDYRFNKFLNVSTSVSDLVPLFFAGIRTDIIEIPADKDIPGPGRGMKRIMNALRRLKGRNFRFILKGIAVAVHKYGFKRFRDDRKTVLISEPLYELEFLVNSLNKYNILYYDFREEGFLGFGTQRLTYDVNLDLRSKGFIKDDTDPFVKLLLENIEEDFAANGNRYLNAVRSIEMINMKHPVSLGIWGVSPSWRSRAMIFEYLSSKGIKVVGSQHGCLYGEALSPWNVETDFNRCDHFISWGFTREDLERVYPSIKIKAEILPLGKTKIVKYEKASRKIDFLFPITVSISMFESGMDRISPDMVVERQITLLEHLNSLKSRDIYIKPFIDSGYLNCSAWSVFERLNNLKVVDNVSLTDFLLEYSPKAVLIEVPSQPLFDVLPLDAEIFLMDDPLNPYEAKALEELKRRVHYCEDTAEAIAKIDLFMKGELEKKRDDTFYKHYMYKEGTEGKILGLIDNLVNR